MKHQHLCSTAYFIHARDCDLGKLLKLTLCLTVLLNCDLNYNKHMY